MLNTFMAGMLVFAIVVIGAALCIHMICTATHLPTNSPASIWLPVATSFAAGVGMVVSGLYGDVQTALKFCVAALCLVLWQSIWLWYHGMYIGSFVKRLLEGDVK